MFAHTIYILKVKKIEASQKIKFCKAPYPPNYWNLYQITLPQFQTPALS